ncbi:hypothetical protein [Acinetobacter baumannii]|uniref:hypothetical protein n=1 Tax=Acinetobacter baumannii TaxID=470 RepID=UPI00103B8599|nr:hypothetical protein [Acinetobacter baumannii]
MTTVFPLTFDCDTSDYLIVKINDVLQVAGTWSLVDSNVVFSIEPLAGSLITIQRKSALKRSTNYSYYDNSFRPESVNKDFDNIWYVLQELSLDNALTQEKFQELIDQLVEGNINGLPAEILARIAGDEANTALINQEVARAYFAEEALGSKINAETARATTAEAALDNRLNALGGGVYGFNTYAEFDAVKATIPANSLVNISEVNNTGTGSWGQGDNVWDGTTLTKSPYDPLALAKQYSDESKFSPYYAKTDFENGFPEAFFDTYRTVNQYKPARYNSGFAQIAAATLTKKLPLSTGFSIRYVFNFTTFMPVAVLGLTSSSSGFIAKSNIGIMTGATLPYAFCFRKPNSEVYEQASSITPDQALNQTHYIELLINGGTLTFKRYTANFESVIESFSTQFERALYTNYLYLQYYSQATTYPALIEINYFNAKSAEKTNKINPKYLDVGGNYMFDDWTRRTTVVSSGATIMSGTDLNLGSKQLTLKFKVNVEAANTTDAFMLGFGNTSTNDRVVIGYESRAGYQGITAFVKDSWYVIVPISDLTDGVYNITLSKDDIRYLYEVRDAVNKLVKRGAFEDETLTSSRLHAVTRLPTASKTVIHDVYLYTASLLVETSAAASGFKDITGRNVVIEHFGGEGNDWCFVRTPDNYSITGKPHRFVILNHGNGWTMDGSLKNANFSSKTQFGVDAQNSGAYLDTSRADYVQYSSPLIEALLAQGFVVCGAQNYADGLYGNKNCRNAVVDFFNYMQRTYNVTERCSMIGASNGAMTTLNACHLLGTSKVASIALLYPLASLFDHYLGYSAHRASILAAYGLSGNTYSDLAALKAEKTFYTHCPVHHFIYGDDLTNQQVKTKAFPPMIVYSSTGDTVTAAANNGKKLKDLCDRSSLICNYTDIDPDGSLGYDHGDYHHFGNQGNGVEIVNFLLANK